LSVWIFSSFGVTESHTFLASIYDNIVRNERDMEEAERCSNTSTGFIVQAVEGTPARELEPTATHRLGLDIGG
jgi:hypothetical protein